jgi:hypothetical protein
MTHPDRALEALREIIGDFANFCSVHGSVSEADTRAKVIDRVLREVCLWPEDEIVREEHVDRGYIDYYLRLNGRAIVAVEAKREGLPFTMPIDGGQKSYSLDGVLVTDGNVREAVKQVHGYCDDAGIRFAIATNGYAWIAFRAIRDDMPWRKGRARVFPSLEHIRDNFTEFWNLLSYEAISAGSLHQEFSQDIGASRELHRVIDNLFNADLPLGRNVLNASIQPLIKLIFEDIADQDHLEVLQSCYVHTGTLRIVANDLDDIITEVIPRFLVDEGAVSVGAADSRAGFERTIERALSAPKGELVLLLGGIGSGKTTFLKRYQRTTGKQLLDTKTLLFAIDFLQAPLDPSALESFVWRSILDDLRERYRERRYERRKFLHEVFQDHIIALESTILADHKPGTGRYNRTLTPFLYKWQEDLNGYAPALLRVTTAREHLAAVVFIDNVDQSPPAYQAQVFLLAQRITRLVGSLTVVALREESYYAASVQKSFTAYTNRKFHIASPHFARMIGSRIAYALKVLEAGDHALSTTKAGDGKSIAAFLQIVEHSIFGKNRNIVRFIGAICHGNMRQALQMFTDFLTSGATDVSKMLRIHAREGSYNVAFHEFVKSIMLGERRYYKEDQSPILNVFNVGSHRNASHFTGLRILLALLGHRGEWTPEGQGYLELAKLLSGFEEIFDNREDFLSTINRLVKSQLVEANTRSTESIEGASHVRITSAGWYYLRYLVRSFAYLDLVLQDTPIDDIHVEKDLRQSVFDVDNLIDHEDRKLERVRTRFARVRTFLDYLTREEETERREFELDKYDSPIGQPVVQEIREQFEKEEKWIERRLRENREKFEEELLVRVAEEEEAAILGSEDSEADDAPAEGNT